MAEMGMAIMGAASASGENRAEEAARRAIASPLLEDISIRGAQGVLINITGGHSLTLHEVNEAASLIQEEADEDANIIFGAVIDETLDEDLFITVIATGFGEEEVQPKAPSLSALRGGKSGDGKRKSRFMGSVDAEVLETPAYARRRPAEADAAQKPGPLSSEDTTEDMPAFLRKQAR